MIPTGYTEFSIEHYQQLLAAGYQYFTQEDMDMDPVGDTFAFFLLTAFKTLHEAIAYADHSGADRMWKWDAEMEDVACGDDGVLFYIKID